MISAKEAFKKSEERKFSLESVFRSNVEVLIENAIDEGKFSVLYEGILYAQLAKELEEKGYTLNRVHRFNSGEDRIIWEISWEWANDED